MLIKIVIGLFVVALAVYDPKICMFVVIGLAPAIVSYLVDTKPGKNTSATIFFFNLTGMTVAGMKFLKGAPIEMKVQNFFMIYLFAGMGYFIVWLVPKITVIIIDYKYERRAVRFREKIVKLVDEWGAEVKN